MAKMYDALKRAEHERKNRDLKDVDIGRGDPSRRDPLREKLIAALRSIECHLPGADSRAVTFVGIRGGAGTSTLLRELATLAASEFGQKVALVDVGAGGHHDAFGVHPSAGLDAVAAGHSQLEDVLQATGIDSLTLSCLTTDDASCAKVLASPGFLEFTEELRSCHDLILFDAPPLQDSSNALLLAPVSDGFVLVLEAEKTRWQVAQEMRERIEGRGGKVLGVILNKRRYHIPKLIYRRI